MLAHATKKFFLFNPHITTKPRAKGPQSRNPDSSYGPKVTPESDYLA
jgi:hypothetical protein